MASMSCCRPLLLALLLAVSGASCAGEQGRGLVLLPGEGPLPAGVTERDPRLFYHDFGHVPDGDTVVRVFQLRNEDPVDVAITRVVPGCGCTVASLRARLSDGSVVPGEPISSKAEKLLVIPPLALAEVEVKIATRDMATKNTDKLITIGLTTDSPNGYFLNLEVHIFVEKPFHVVPAALALGRVPVNGGGEAGVEIVPAPGFTQVISEILALPAGVRAELAREERQGIPVWTLRAVLDPPLALGPRQETLRLATESAPGVPGREIEVQLTAQIVPDLSAEPERLVFAADRALSRSASTEVFSLLAGHRLRVTALEVPEEHRAQLEASVEPLEPDDGGASLRWKVELRTKLPLGAEPLLTGKLVLHLDDPQHPSFELPYAVHVK